MSRVKKIKKTIKVSGKDLLRIKLINKFSREANEKKIYNDYYRLVGSALYNNRTAKRREIVKRNAYIISLIYYILCILMQSDS